MKAIEVLKELLEELQPLKMDCYIVNEYSDSQFIEWNNSKTGDYINGNELEWLIETKIKELNNTLNK